MFNFLKRKKASYTVSNDMRDLKTDRTILRASFVKQNILGFSSCLFVLLFSLVFKNIMVSKYFNIINQILFLLLFSVTMAFLSLMLFQLNKKLLQWWILGYIICSLIMFIDIINFGNLLFYFAIIITYIYLYFTSYLYKKSDDIYLKFNWKVVFRNGFVHQFASIMILILAIMVFGFIKIDSTSIKSWSIGNLVQAGLDSWTEYKPDSSLNRSFDDVIDNFITTSPILNTFQKQYSFLGISGEKIITDNIKSIFKNGFDSKTKLSQIIVDYFNKSSQTIKTIVFSFFMWFVLSTIGFFYFISRTIVYYLSYFIISILMWLKFFKIAEKPAVKEYLIL